MNKEGQAGMSSQARGRAEIITAMIAFGTIGIFVKSIALASAEIALYRAVIAFTVLLAVMLVTGRFAGLKGTKKQLWKLFLSGAAMGFNWILLFEAYRYTSVALSTLSYYFAPTLIIIASTVLLKEKLTIRQILCFAASTAGLVLIIGVSGGGSSDLIGILYGLGAAVLYAVVITLNKVTTGIDGITRTWLQFIAAILVVLPYVWVTCGFHFGGLDAKGLACMLIIGVVHTGLMYCLYFSSLTRLRGQQAAILSYIDPLVAVLLSVLWLGEAISPLQLFGGAMILVFALLNEVKLGKKEPELSEKESKAEKM